MWLLGYFDFPGVAGVWVREGCWDFAAEKGRVFLGSGSRPERRVAAVGGWVASSCVIVGEG